jgi:valyl-tRNA synthetase
MLQPFPSADEGARDEEAVAEMEWVMQFVLGVRRIKGEMNIAPGKALPVMLQHASRTDRNWLQKNRRYLDFLARLDSATLLSEQEQPPESATALVGQMKLLIPMAGLIDKEAEQARLAKEIARIRKDMERIEAKLANPNFVEKAPPAVVQKEQSKLADQGSALAKLSEQLEKIRGL